MILRRIKAHVEKENWFAVGIDFVIVVVGVFLGIQIGNWNEVRVSNVKEAEYLEQLRNEIATNADMVRSQARYVDRVIEAGRNGIQFLESGEPCQAGCERLIIDLFHASQVWGLAFFQDKYQETNRLGIPSDEPLRLVVQDFYSFISGWSAVNATPPAYRERVRGYIPVDAIKVLWTDCHEIVGTVEEFLTFGCEAALSEMELARALSEMQSDPELIRALRFWVGQNEFAKLNYPTLIKRSDASVDAINQHLEQKR
ncbi:MAG: hypothetical protein AAGB02_04545 [Pseudomonadota bacterium]